MTPDDGLIQHVELFDRQLKPILSDCNNVCYVNKLIVLLHALTHFAMISTSSSECDCTGPFAFSTKSPYIIGNPFCCTTRQPLIYYARIQDPFLQGQNRGHIKNNSNCFMKAFQWYTQERGSGHSNEIASSKVNNSDFASWLDKKYNEYLKRSQQDGTQVVLEQSPIVKGDKMVKKQKSSRKFGRMRSPWKRRRHMDSKDKGDIDTINQSIEFILQPQDLQKPASEFCQRNSRIQSSTTIISKESPKHTKLKIKSNSLLSIYRAQGVCEKKVKNKSHAENICECQKNDKGTQYDTFSLETLMASRNYTTRTPEMEQTNKSDVITIKYSPQRTPRSNVLCQCTETERDIHSNAEYKTDPSNNAFSAKMLKTEVKFNENPDLNVPKLQNFSAQTSDHSINLASVNYQPLLLKVVHMNK